MIARVAIDLLSGVAVDDDHGRKQRVRLCGVAALGLEPRDAPRQLTLQEPVRQKGERLGDTLDQIRSKFGGEAIGRAIHAGRRTRDRT